jgi:putative transposase
MSRLPRVAIPGYPHHVTQRGNRRANVFMDDMDHHVYLKLLVKSCVTYGVKIWAYCLMINHVHLVAVPIRKESLSQALQQVHGDYADYFNAKYLKSGHLWQGRFKSAVMDSSHLWNGVRYVERNPVRAGIVARAEDFRWSSAAPHCGLRTDKVLSNDLPLLEEISNWSEWLSGQEKEESLRFIRERTRTGRPCADDESIRAMENLLGRTLMRQKPGPTKKEKTSRNGGDQLHFPES